MKVKITKNITLDEIFNNSELYEKMYEQLLKDRIIYINGIITDDIVDRITMQILMFNHREKNIPKEQLKPITIYLNSDGGDVIVTNHLVEVIRNSRIPIHVVVLAKALSAGLLITLACHKRMATKESVFLLHDGDLQLAGSSGKAKDTMEFLNTLEEKIDKLVLERTKLTEEEYERLKRKELYVFGEQALELGFIDELI